MSTLSPNTAFSRVIDVQTEGALPRSLEIDANEKDRARISEWLGIPSVDRLRASVTLERWRARGVRVLGSLEAEVVQSCVVTLEPIKEAVAAEFEWHFLPGTPKSPKRDLELQVEELDFEPLESGKIDVGAIIAEELSLSLNPHPRKPDANLEAESGSGPAEKKENPFAALAALKVKDRPEGSG
jgi:uncharacterized metal-binding protein YceD (DUF177 family)